MTNTPLSATEQSKVMIFTLMMIPIILMFGAGILPALFLGFGLFMMKKQKDFCHFETAVKNFNFVLYLACVILTLIALYYVGEYLSIPDDEYYLRPYAAQVIWICLVIFGITLAYVVAVRFLFLKPLQAHSDWVVSNGIFSSKPKAPLTPTTTNLDIIQGEKLRSYSVADELLKWAKLKEDGHISEEEYNEARRKLLKRA